MKLIKINENYFLRFRYEKMQVLINTHLSSLREAQVAAVKMMRVFEKEKMTRKLTDTLCSYVKALAKKTLSLESAKGAIHAVENEAYRMALDAVDSIFPSPGITASEVWNAYEKSDSKVKASTLATKKQRFSIFQKWAGDTDMRGMNKARCMEFLNSLSCAPQTWNNYISDLSSCFSACPEVDNPWNADLRKNAGDSHKERQPMSIDTAKAILAFCDKHKNDLEVCHIPLFKWANFLRVLYYTGQRPVDICQLERSEIKGNTIDLLPEKTSRTRRKVSYQADVSLVPILDSIPKDNTGLYFPEFSDIYHRNRGNVEAGFKELLRKANLNRPGVCLYGFRHLYVTFQINAGMSAENVASVVGHTSTQTTEDFYYHGKTNVQLNNLPRI